MSGEPYITFSGRKDRPMCFSSLGRHYLDEPHDRVPRKGPPIPIPCEHDDEDLTDNFLYMLTFFYSS